VQPLNPIVGGITLRIPAIRSPDYVPGVSGWTVNIDGSVEFNDGTFRGTVTAGTFQGNDFVINTQGIFLYSGAPAAGNLIISLASAGGTDTFGNVFPSGINVSGGNLINIPSANGSDVALTTEVYGDAFARFVLAVNGTMNWGDGVHAPDTSLFRPQANQLNTQGTFGIGLEAKVGTYLVRELSTGDATWQAPAYTTGWSGTTAFGTLATGTFQTLQFRFDGQDGLVADGAFQAAASAPGTAVCMLPAGPPSMRPVAGHPLTIGKYVSPGPAVWGACYISAAGNLNLNTSLGSTVTASAQYIIPAQTIPLGIMP
jgi:hypothetical protein